MWLAWLVQALERQLLLSYPFWRGQHAAQNMYHAAHLLVTMLLVLYHTQLA